MKGRYWFTNHTFVDMGWSYQRRPFPIPKNVCPIHPVRILVGVCCMEGRNRNHCIGDSQFSHHTAIHGVAHGADRILMFKIPWTVTNACPELTYLLPKLRAALLRTTPSSSACYAALAAACDSDACSNPHSSSPNIPDFFLLPLFSLPSQQGPLQWCMKRITWKVKKQNWKGSWTMGACDEQTSSLLYLVPFTAPYSILHKETSCN